MSKTVLIVDDHPSFRGMARALLESEGFTVVGEAEDGATAIARYRELHPTSCCSTCSSRTPPGSPSLPS